MQFEKNTAIKVLSDGKSCHGGHYVWDLPKRKNGKWTPGKWTEPVSPKLCYCGYHLTYHPTEWWDDVDEPKAYLVQYRGKKTREEDHKFAVASCRLLRPLTPSELRSCGIYTSGEHWVSNVSTNIRVSGPTILHTDECASVHVSGDAVVHASGTGIVTAHGKSEVVAADNIQVVAHDESSVLLEDSCTAEVHDKSSVRAGDYSRVSSWGESKVTAVDYAMVDAWGESKVVAEDSTCVVSRSNYVKIHAGDKATVILSGSTPVVTRRDLSTVIHHATGKTSILRYGCGGMRYKGNFVWETK